ncbi:MAG: hypothetical protein KJ655_01320 [Candidatus Thermoplasmatota archaeon]|nr:hypothetical protein [Candidatus Thermoplasmatota archaeon]
MRDNKGQLLLLAVVFLAITLIVLASAATVFLNVKQNQMNGSFADEYDNIKEKFGFALNDNLNKYYNNSTDERKNETIKEAFNVTLEQFDYLLTFHGMSINITLVNITGLTYSINETVELNISFKIEGGGTSISEVIYFRFEITEGEVTITEIRVRPDALGDEVIIEGDAGGVAWDPDGISVISADDDTTRNITEDGIGLIDEINYVDENVTTYGTIENFTYAKDEDGNNATLTEEDTGGAKSPDIVTLLPNAEGTATGLWTYVGGSGNYANLQTNDGDTTYAYLSTGNNVDHTVNLDDTALTGTINSVIAYVVGRAPGATDDHEIKIYIGATTYNSGVEFGPPSTYTTYSWVMTTSPATGVAWTWAEVNSLQVGIETDVWSGQIYYTQMYAVVDYTPATAANYQLNITFNTTSVVSADNYYLQLNYSTTDEIFDVLVYNATTGSYEDIGDLTATTMTQVQFTLASDHYNGGTVSVRYVGQNETGDSTSQDKLYIEYHRIRSYTPSTDYSLNVSYTLDGSIDGYNTYNLTVKANTSGASTETFNVTYQIDGAGEWYVLGTGTIEGTTEQELSVILTVKPTTKVVVRFVDNTPGTILGPNTLQIDFIELYCTN